jgi:hypothetical protein
MKQSGLRRIGAVVVICALAGALAGIAGSAAAPSKSKATQAQKKAKAQRQARRAQGTAAPFFGGGPLGPGDGPVHSESVVPNADGTGFNTITTDGGTLTSVDGSTLHIKEGTDKATYKDDVAIDAGSNPTVIRNHAKAALSDLKADDHVRVIQGTPQGTIVIAEDAATAAQDQKDHEGFGHGHFGPPPPGAPAAPGSFPGDRENGSGSSGSPAGGSSS